MTPLRRLFHRRPDADLAREIDAHMAERVDELIEDGLAEADARAQAAREFGNRTLEIEQSREVWIAPWLTSVWQDLRYAARSLARKPGFTLSAVGILAIGIGLVTTLFNVVNGIALRPWRVPDPSSLVIVTPHSAPDAARSDLSSSGGPLSIPEYRYLRDTSRTFSHLASWMSSHMRGVVGARIVHADATTGVDLNFVSANYFDALRIGMQMGRTFQHEDEDYTSPRSVAIISDRLWRDFFGASESIVGTTIRVDDHPFVVVGVAQRDFRDVGYRPVDLWLPLPSVALGRLGLPGDIWLQRFADPRSNHVYAVGRLATDATRDTAESELTVLSRQFRTSLSMEPHGFTLRDTRPISAVPVGALREAAWIGLVFMALFFVMLLACANVGNLILARGLTRQREIAIRLSLGASRARVTRQLLTESLVLSLMAGAVALWIASLAPRLLDRWIGIGAQRLSPDAVVFGFVLLMALVACLVSGMLPALRSTRINLATRVSERHAGSAGAGRLRTSLLAAQVALSMVLLVGAGLLTRTIGHILSSDPGFAIHEVQALTVQPTRSLTAEGRSLFARTLRDALQTTDLPPVASSEFTAISRTWRSASIRKDGEPRETARTLPVRGISANYFNVLQIPLVAGRTMTDDEQSPEVVISESAAKLFWPGESPLGKRLVSRPRSTAATSTNEDVDRFHEVVGVVKDVPFVSLTKIEPVVYWPASSHNVFFIRDLSPAIADRVAAVARGIEPEASVTARPLADDLRNPIGGIVIGSYFAWTIGLLALTLAIIGAFGVFAYMVEERRREIGVRMALGATPASVVRTVIGGARRPLLFGLGAGLMLSLAAAPLLRSFLYGLSPFDPITYAGIAVILVTAALVATWIPARRATRIDPAVTLRGN